MEHIVLNPGRHSDEWDILSVNLKSGNIMPASIDPAGSCQSLLLRKAVHRLLINSHECDSNDH